MDDGQRDLPGAFNWLNRYFNGDFSDVDPGDETPAIRALLAVEEIVRTWEATRPPAAWSLGDFVHGIATMIEGDPQAFRRTDGHRGRPQPDVAAVVRRQYVAALMFAIMEAGRECGQPREQLLKQIGGCFDLSKREVERRLAEIHRARKVTANK